MGVATGQKYGSIGIDLDTYQVLRRLAKQDDRSMIKMLKKIVLEYARRNPTPSDAPALCQQPPVRLNIPQPEEVPLG